MNPKDKAHQMIDALREIVGSWSVAKSCALLSVELIMLALGNDSGANYKIMPTDIWNKYISYWKAVKKAITAYE